MASKQKVGWGMGARATDPAVPTADGARRHQVAGETIDVDPVGAVADAPKGNSPAGRVTSAPAWLGVSRDRGYTVRA